MFIEKRKVGRDIKYYLVHSIRLNDKISKIRIYLGKNLDPKTLADKKNKAKVRINDQLEKQNTKVFQFSLSKNQINRLNRFNDKLTVHHLNQNEWKKFTEQFVYNTNAIEGSTVKLDEVGKILRQKKFKNSDEIETKNVAEAVEYLRNTKDDISIDFIIKIHKICFSKSKHFAGKLRDCEVVIKDSMGNIVHQGVPSKDVKLFLIDLIEWEKENRKKFKPLVMAAFIHNQFEYIHPFQDGNGRVGRLLLNFILIKFGYRPININLVNRSEYYAALRSYDLHNDIKPFLLLLIKEYKQTLKQVTTKK